MRYPPILPLIRLGLAAGAICFATAVAGEAQVVVPPASEVPLPPRQATDTTTPKPDTLKSPFGRAVSPRTADIGPQYEWDRAGLFASGALTVADLLELVPGATSFRSGWLASPKFVAVNGELNRIRVYQDGIEMDNIDPRSGPLLDLTTVQLWTLEAVAIQRFANELRVHLRSWRANHTTAYTRTDLLTGDADTNIYRGFFAKRFNNGAGVQLGAQQFNTRAGRLGGGGDALSLIARVGIARRFWSLDGFANSTNRSRVLQPTFGSGLSIPNFAGTHTLAYLRAAVGNQTGGPWAQLVTSNMRLAENSDHVTADVAPSRRVLSDTTDTTTRRSQFVLAAGIARGPLRAVVTDRIRSFDGNTHHTPGVELEASSSLGLAGLSAERDTRARTTRADGVFRFSPVPFLAVAGAISRSTPDSTGTNGQATLTAARLEAGGRLLGPWLTAGLITRDTSVLVPPTVFDTAYATRVLGRRQGLFLALRGRLYKDLGVDVIGTRWDSAGFYQPRYQARSEINLITQWLSRFPSGNLGLKGAFIYDYRSEVAFPTASGTRLTNSSGIMSALVEIRIMRGVLSYQVRNIVGDNYQIVPDFFMPRQISVYGVRWEFSN